MKTLLFLFFLLCAKFFLTLHLFGTTQHEKEAVNGFKVLEFLGDGKKEIRNTTLALFRNGKQISLGTLIDARGLFLSKASACVGAKFAKTSSGEIVPIRIRKRDPKTDLALLQITESSKVWPSVNWEKKRSKLSEGTWVTCSSPSLSKVYLSTVTGNLREILKEGGVMGVEFNGEDNSSKGVSLEEVFPHSAADRAGLRINDQIVSIDGLHIKSSKQIYDYLGKKDPGDLLRLQVKRKDKRLDVRVTLGHRSVTFDLFNRNLLISGPTSKRKDNFPLVLQHDAPMNNTSMGGGLFTPYGYCVGINIARVDRVTNYALPTSIIRPILGNWLKDI